MPSSAGITDVVSVAVLLPVFASLVEELTVAVLVIVPPLLGSVTTMVMAGSAPAAFLSPVPATTQPSTLPLHDALPIFTKVTPAGSVSLTLTFAAVLGPALLTLSV